MMTNVIDLDLVLDDDTPTDPTVESKYIKREVERLVFTGKVDKAYAMYLTDPTLTNPLSLDDFASTFV